MKQTKTLVHYLFKFLPSYRIATYEYKFKYCEFLNYHVIFYFVDKNQIIGTIARTGSWHHKAVFSFNSEGVFSIRERHKRLALYNSLVDKLNQPASRLDILRLFFHSLKKPGYKIALLAVYSVFLILIFFYVIKL